MDSVVVAEEDLVVVAVTVADEEVSAEEEVRFLLAGEQLVKGN